MKPHSLITAAISYVVLSTTSEAVGLIGIGSNGSFYTFDSTSPGTVSQLGSNGAATGIIDLDVHGANGVLYGIAGNGAVSSISTGNGSLTPAYSPLTPFGVTITSFDHNPMADRVRVVGGNSNFRYVPDVVTPPQPAGIPGTVINDGMFSFVDSLGGARSGVMIAGAGYTNPVNNPMSTTLYTITSDGFLNIHTTAQGGTMGSFGLGTAVGLIGLGFTPVGSGFDFDVNGFGYAYDGSALRQIDLNTGLSVSLGAVGLPGGVSLTSLAVIPEPSTVLLGSLAGLGLLRRRRTA